MPFLNIRFLLQILIIYISFVPVYGQNDPDQDDKLNVFGQFQTRANFFLRDSLIGAANIPQYDHQLFGSESWLNLQADYQGFSLSLRFDYFNNSNLLVPTDSYSDQGIGNFLIEKTLDKLTLSAGYIYDQIGSGLIFRSFEERSLLIDNALAGIKLKYQLLPDLFVKAFSGRQKRQFELYPSVIRGFQSEYFRSFLLGGKTVSWAPGVGIVARTIDDASMNNLVSTLQTYPGSEVFVPKYNTYAGTYYQTIQYGSFRWYAEAAHKSKDTYIDPFAVTLLQGDTLIGNRYKQGLGFIFYSTLSYATDAIGITLEGKRTKNFSFKTRPQEQLNRGNLNFLPPLTRVNSFRLNTRYNPAAQELEEWSWQGDIQVRLSEDFSMNLNHSGMQMTAEDPLYREWFLEFTKQNEKQHWTVGIQHQLYNQQFYEFKPGAPTVKTITPFAEIEMDAGKGRSLRIEAQALFMNKGNDFLLNDYGHWMFGLAEYVLSPKWKFSMSDMFNWKPGRFSPKNSQNKSIPLHFPRFDVYYQPGNNLFSLSYIKQVEGVICTGGICRLEPAFSGVRLSLNSSF